MLDDQIMEKKCLTCGPPSLHKPNSSEPKNKQDGSTKFPRVSKRRESTNGPSELSRKFTPQRNRNFTDKRPRPRGGQYFDRDRGEVANLVDTSVDSDVKQGSKKVSLSHLLNFSFAPRVGTENNWLGASFHSSSRSKGRVKLPRYNKEQFLLANCQFVVHDGGNYEVHAADPDVLVDWGQIEEIHLSTYETPLCPICLYPPVAAKITCCGHIYCWSCVLHYLALSDKTWRKCPICYEAVHKKDLKSVRITVKKNFQVRDEITMYLMKRSKGSAIPVPVLHWFGPPELPFHLKDETTTIEFQKVLVATNNDVRDIIHRERAELDRQLSEEQDTPESCFIVSAQQLLSERETKLELENSCNELCQRFEENNLESASNILNKKHEVVDYFDGEQATVTLVSDSAIFGTEIPENIRQRYVSSSTDSTGSIGFAESIQSVVSEDFDPSQIDCTNMESSKRSPQKDSYYFYQASDGQHIYLHALNIKMLVMEYGSLENCPPVLTAKIVELERTSMTDSLRKRLRYLQHLPLTCEFEVVELQLEHPVVSEETIKAFSDDLDKRRRQRNRRAREEREREREMQVKENIKLGKYPASEYCLDSFHQFPTCSGSLSNTEVPETQHGFTNQENGISSTSSSEDTSVSDVLEDPAASKQTSFAQMLREGKTKSWTVEFSHPAVVDNPDSSLNIKSKGRDTPELESYNYAPPPIYQQSFSEAIQAAIDNAVQQKQTGVAGGQENGRKKKKGKKMVLFSTNMNRKN